MGVLPGVSSLVWFKYICVTLVKYLFYFINIDFSDTITKHMRYLMKNLKHRLIVQFVRKL